VAAVCYRIRNKDIEFLLVRTRAGRWTFPKGRIDDDPSPAHAAAREAYEEAGVHGRVDQQPFASYLHAKATGLFPGEHSVDAHLCHVFDLSEAEESYRDPTWFSVEKSKRRLHEGRRPHHGNELERVVDAAVSLIASQNRLA
jgi:8-oxo-dGTP pyrophosphatase MutT (NUDIX family)